ncbi:MAG: hypothetical protein M9962_12145 [Oligoflexia bacterium]|nr:hypothetical protein [Oligoflexia bacterium]
MRLVKPIVMIVTLCSLSANSEGASTKCENKVSGEWKFGSAPNGCDSNTYGQESSVWSLYSPLVMDERSSGLNQERKRYVGEMFVFLRDVADYYLLQRREKVQEQEKFEWRKAVMALAHQESYWSHYRISKVDHNLKLMRGDSLHGWGLVQIDDRWHSNMIKTAKAWELIGNLLYGLDMYFKFWEKAPSQACVTDGNFQDRARSAYSMYNGGPSKGCRWNDSSDKWAKNDKGFLEKYSETAWMQEVPNKNIKSGVDVVCLIEGGSSCGSDGVVIDTTEYWYQEASTDSNVQYTAQAYGDDL